MNRRQARLVYDSAGVPSCPGKRSALSADRFLQFESGPFSIDLVANGAAGEHTRMLHGQIVDVTRKRPVASASVRSRCVGSSTRTDELGQFAVLLPAGDEESRTLEIETASGPVVVTMPALGTRPWTED